MKGVVVVVTVVLGLALVPPVAALDITGVSFSGSYQVAIDSALLETDFGVFMYQTPGWGGDTMALDTFLFSDVASWLRSVKVFMLVDSVPYRLDITHPMPDSWYYLAMVPPVSPGVKFIPPPGLEGCAGGGLGLRSVATVAQDRVVFELAGSGSGLLEIFDAAGKPVCAIPISGSGTSRLVWHGDDSQGRPVPVGLYFCRLLSRAGSAVTRVVLIR
ncbi:MAG: hypothetical protein ABIK44_00340 [candidate division WOR-3 bacterium]